MSSHLFSPSHGAEESVVLTRIQNTYHRHSVNVPVCVRVFVCVSEIQRIKHCTSSGTSFSSPDSPVSITLSFQRNHTREKNKISY